MCARDLRKSGLTDLPNRRHLEIEIDRIVAERAEAGLPEAVIIINLGFKYINDCRGHSVGDHVLIRGGGRAARRDAAVDVLGRLGGDEFAAVLPGATADDAQGVVHRLLENLRSEPIVVESGRCA